MGINVGHEVAAPVSGAAGAAVGYAQEHAANLVKAHQLGIQYGQLAAQHAHAMASLAAQNEHSRRSASLQYHQLGYDAWKEQQRNQQNELDRQQRDREQSAQFGQQTAMEKMRQSGDVANDARTAQRQQQQNMLDAVQKGVESGDFEYDDRQHQDYVNLLKKRQEAITSGQYGTDELPHVLNAYDQQIMNNRLNPTPVAPDRKKQKWADQIQQSIVTIPDPNNPGGQITLIPPKMGTVISQPKPQPPAKPVKDTAWKDYNDHYKAERDFLMKRAAHAGTDLDTGNPREAAPLHDDVIRALEQRGIHPPSQQSTEPPSSPNSGEPTPALPPPPVLAGPNVEAEQLHDDAGNPLPIGTGSPQPGQANVPPQAMAQSPGEMMREGMTDPHAMRASAIEPFAHAIPGMPHELATYKELARRYPNGQGMPRADQEWMQKKAGEYDNFRESIHRPEPYIASKPKVIGRVYGVVHAGKKYAAMWDGRDFITIHPYEDRGDQAAE